MPVESAAPQARSRINEVAGPAIALAAAAFFAFLAREVTLGRTQGFDLHIRAAVHSLANPVLTYAMRGVTLLGEVAILVPFGAVVVWRLLKMRRPRAATLFVIASIGGELCDQGLKYLFRRPRPEVYFGLGRPHGYSFPSGHSVESCVFFGVLAALLAAGTRSRRRKAAIWISAALLTLAIGLSRVYLGVHYPTDVLAGYAVAVVWAGLVRAGYAMWLRRRSRPSIS